MTAMRWVLLAFGVIVAFIALATVLAVRARRYQRPRVSYRPRDPRSNRLDRVHRQVANYRASGALPRWDP